MNRREAIKAMTVMLGASLSPSVLRAFEASSSPIAHGQFSSQQAQAIAAMSERIIPTTDTPGAITAGVPAFIEEIVFSWYTETERKVFLHGLAQLESLSRQQLGKSFVDLQDALQDVVLQQMEIQGGGSPLIPDLDLMPKLGEDKKAFFPKLKELVVVGYYTSEIGATQELRYVPMPMAYKGDVPLSDQDRNWANNGFTD